MKHEILILLRLLVHFKLVESSNKLTFSYYKSSYTLSYELIKTDEFIFFIGKLIDVKGKNTVGDIFKLNEELSSYKEKEWLEMLDSSYLTILGQLGPTDSINFDNNFHTIFKFLNLEEDKNFYIKNEFLALLGFNGLALNFSEIKFLFSSNHYSINHKAIKIPVENEEEFLSHLFCEINSIFYHGWDYKLFFIYQNMVVTFERKNIHIDYEPYKLLVTGFISNSTDFINFNNNSRSEITSSISYTLFPSFTYHDLYLQPYSRPTMFIDEKEYSLIGKMIKREKGQDEVKEINIREVFKTIFKSLACNNIDFLLSDPFS